MEQPEVEAEVLPLLLILLKGKLIPLQDLRYTPSALLILEISETIRDRNPDPFLFDKEGSLLILPEHIKWGP